MTRQEYYFKLYNNLNSDPSHMSSDDDICTSMECVKLMLDYIPKNFWKNDLKILDPCCGNGNFGAYCMFKTSIDNIWFNDINSKRNSIINHFKVTDYGKYRIICISWPCCLWHVNIHVERPARKQAN